MARNDRSANGTAQLVQTDETGTPITEPRTGLDAAAAGELGSGIRPTPWDQFFSQAGLGMSEGPTPSLVRAFQQYQASAQAASSGTPKLSPDEANQLYPGLPEPFKESVYPEVARLIADHAKFKQQTQAWISRGSEGGFLHDLGAGLFGGLDPANLLMGEGIGAAAKGLGLAQNLTLRGARNVYLQNLAANLLGEIPGYLQRPQENQPNPTPLELLGGATSGALLGSALHLGMEAAFRDAGEVAKRTPPAVQEKNIESAIAMHEAGKNVDMTPAVVTQEVRDAGLTAPGIENPYVFRPLNHASEVNYYVPVDPHTGAIPGVEDLGGAIIGVDNKAAANNQAGLPESIFNGKVIRAEVSPDASTISMDTPIQEFFGVGRDKAFEKIQGILGWDDRRMAQFNDGLREIWTQKGTVRDLFNLFQDAATTHVRPFNDLPANDFARLLDGMGYDGAHFNGKVGDTPIDNRIMMFNHDKISPVEVTDAAKNEVPALTDEARKALSDQVNTPENSRTYDPDMKQVVDKNATRTDEPAPKSTPAQPAELLHPEISAAEQSARAQLEAKAKEAGSEWIAEEMKRIDEESRTGQHIVEAAKNLAKCLGENTA